MTSKITSSSPCAEPSTCVILSADDGKIITTLPLAGGSDGGGFNPVTMEAFSSHGNGTLTIIKENSPTSFEVEQTVQTKPGGKCCTLDTKTGHILVTAIEAAPAAAGAAPATPPRRRRSGGGRRAWRAVAAGAVDRACLMSLSWAGKRCLPAKKTSVRRSMTAALFLQLVR